MLGSDRRRGNLADVRASQAEQLQKCMASWDSRQEELFTGQKKEHSQFVLALYRQLQEGSDTTVIVEPHVLIKVPAKEESVRPFTS